MALNQKELVQASSGDVFAARPQVSMNDQITAIFGTSATEDKLTYCTPVGYNESTGFYGEWIAPDPTVLVVTSGTGGTWGLTYNGVVLANTTFAHNATAALVKATLASRGIDASVELDTGVYTITFDSDKDVAVLPVVAGDVTQLTGGSPSAVPTAGTATLGLHVIRGFVWPEEVQLDDTNEVQGKVMVQGRLPYRNIASTQAAGDLAALQVELKRTPLGRGIIVEDLVNIH